MKLIANMFLLFSICFFTNTTYGKSTTASHIQATADTAYIAGHISNNLMSAFTVEITTGKDLIYHYVGTKKYTIKSDKGGSFKAHIPLHQYAVKTEIFFTNEGKRLALLSYYIEPGDSIYITIDQAGRPMFSGKGAAKFRYKNSIDSLIKEIRLKYIKETPVPLNSAIRVRNYFEKVDYVALSRRNILKSYENLLSPVMKTLFEADITGEEMLSKYSVLRTAYFQLPEDAEILQLAKQLENIPLDTADAAIKVLSGSYTDFLFTMASTELSFKTKDRTNSVKDLYQKLKNKYDGILRERVLTKYLIRRSSTGETNDDYEICLRDAIAHAENHLYKDALQSQLSSFAKKAEAFNFSLPDTTGKIITLNSLRGKVVLIDFWFTGCRPCMDLAKKLHTDVMPQFNTKDIVFVSINVDEDKTRWLKSVREGKYTASGSVNLFTEGLAFDHPLIKYYNIQGCPALLLIDDEGKIFSATPPRDSEGLNALIQRAMGK